VTVSGQVEIRSVYTDEDAQPHEIDAVARAFRDVGFDVEVNPGFVRRSAGPLPWAVIVTLAGVPITAFFTAIAHEAGKDVYAAAKDFILRLWQSRDRPEGTLEFVDGDGTRLILSTRISKRALEALAEVDWPAKRGHYLVWDEERDEWRDPTRRALGDGT
jgi:hypothetical protein